MKKDSLTKKFFEAGNSIAMFAGGNRTVDSRKRPGIIAKAMVGVFVTVAAMDVVVAAEAFSDGNASKATIFSIAAVGMALLAHSRHKENVGADEKRNAAKKIEAKPPKPSKM